MDPFTELRKHAGGNHPQKAKLNIVLSAITDVIYERRGANASDAKPISNTEYFAALMTALESAAASHQQEITQLLAMVLPVVPEAVLRAKYSAIAKCIVRVIQEADGEGALLRSGSACLGLVLLAQEPSAAVWGRPEVLKSFQLLLSLATDARPKIRKGGQKWTTDILQLHADNNCDALSTHIASFSENVFASASSSKDEARLVQLIGFLKTALPLLQKKVVSSLVDALSKYVNSSAKNLRIVTYEALDALTRENKSKLSQETLAKILSTLLNADDSTVHNTDTGAFAVRILETSLVRLQKINEPMARELLPRVVVNVCAHFESANAKIQKQTSRSLVYILTRCVSPTVLEEEATYTDIARILTSLQSLMTLRFQGAWKHIFSMLASLFTFYGSVSSPALDPILITCCELHEAAENMPGRNGGDNRDLTNLFVEVAGAAVAAIGPRQFLDIVPLDHPTEVISEKRLWLLPVFNDSLKSYACELEFFASKMLAFARDCELKTREDNATPLMIKKYQMLTMQIWALFPSFCANAVDIDTNFKKIAKILANAMADKRYPELRLSVCQGLQALVKKTRVLKAKRDNYDADDEEEEYDEEDDEEVDEEKLTRDRAALGKYSSKYLPLLISFVEELDPEKDAEKSQILMDTVEGFASLAEPAFVTTTFKKIMQKLLEATTQAKRMEAAAAESAAKEGVDSSASKAQQKAQLKLKHVAHAQMSLAMTLIQHMDMDNINLLYRVIKPYLLDDTDGAMQKRSYAVLVSICDNHPSFMTTEANLKDMTESICESLLTCSIPAKKMRLRCLVHLINAMVEAPQDVNVDNLIPNLVGEIILCTKEANGKAREAAFELLVAMAHLMKAKHPEHGLMEYLQMVLGGLAARTPHMRSASVVCLSRLVFEFGREEAVIQAAMPQLLKTVLMLLHEKAREVIKSVIGFMKLGIAMLPKDQLREFLPDITNGLLVWIGESKNRFRAKTRIILIKLCRKYGYDEVAELVPEEDRALIKHIKKTKEREDKKKAEGPYANKKDASKGDGTFEEFMADSDDEGDDEDGDHAMGGEVQAALKRKKDLHRKNKNKVIREDDDDIVDFLDSNAAVKNVYSAYGDDDNSDDDEDFQMSKDGRLIIPDKDAKMGDDDDSEDEELIKMDVASQLEKMGLHHRDGSKSKRKRDDGDAGKEYRAKKAGGDIKKKGKLEPYAYIPLDPKFMAKRNKRNAVDRYSNNVGKRRNSRK
uniref:Uncharacterized protein n=1 Tax=Globisporangium ultimum (strain ATCC 200006 / CBS 805.95 / DAOM BR144) TaxID=431595 RepID=K3WEP6_GLOUD